MKYWEYLNNKLSIGHEIEGGGWYIEIPLNKGELFRLYEVPQYGGEPRYFNSYETLQEAIDASKLLT